MPPSLMRWDLDSLKSFVAVVECADLTQAAKREHQAVSAASQRMAEVRALAGTTLQQRCPRGVALTPAGQPLLQALESILARQPSVRSSKDQPKAAAPRRRASSTPAAATE